MNFGHTEGIRIKSKYFDDPLKCSTLECKLSPPKYDNVYWLCHLRQKWLHCRKQDFHRTLNCYAYKQGFWSPSALNLRRLWATVFSTLLNRRFLTIFPLFIMAILYFFLIIVGHIFFFVPATAFFELFFCFTPKLIHFSNILCWMLCSHFCSIVER